MCRKLFILVGNIGSGKSTFAKKFIQEYIQEKIVCVQRDGLRYMIGCGEYIFDLELEPTIMKANLQLVRCFMKAGVDILIDEVNVSKKYRRDYLKLANKYNYQKIAFVLPKLSREESVRRRLQNDHGNQGKEVWEQVWNRFNEVYEKPTLKEGFDEVRLVY